MADLSDTFIKDWYYWKNGPGGEADFYGISPPNGVTQEQFDQDIIDAGTNYVQGPYKRQGLTRIPQLII